VQSAAEELLHTTVRLEGHKKDGTSVGTGFFFFHDNRLYIVTNKHVIEGVISGSFSVLKGQGEGEEKRPILGEFHKINFTESHFIGHPNPDIDVAVKNVSTELSEIGDAGQTAFWKHITAELFPTEEHFNKYIGPMEEVVFIGYPSGIWDTKNLLPITRKGMTASPCYIDFEGEKKFLIDASVFPGSSGSPVFIYYVGGHSDKQGNMYTGNRIHFIGVIAKVYQRVEQGEVQVIDIPTEQKAISQVYQMIDLGITFKAETIIETIDHFLAVVAAKESAPQPLISRNSPCHCGSGKRYKDCHGKLG